MQLRRTLIIPGAAAGWAVLEMASIGIHPTPDLGAERDALRSFLHSAEPGRYETATVVHFVALGLLVVAATGLWEGLRRRGAPASAYAAAMTALGVCIAAYLTGRALVSGVVRQAEDQSPLVSARPLLDAGTASMWLGTAALGAFAIATAVGIFLTEAPSRWLPSSGAVIGAALVPALPLAQSAYVHVVSLAMMLWIVVASYRCSRPTAAASSDLTDVVAHR